MMTSDCHDTLTAMASSSRRKRPPTPVMVNTRLMAPKRDTEPNMIQVPAGYLPEWRVELMHATEAAKAARNRQEELIGQALLAGATWSEIAGALKVSRQSAHQRFRHLIPAKPLS